jgi:hypothetical protein
VLQVSKRVDCNKEFNTTIKQQMNGLVNQNFTLEGLPKLRPQSRSGRITPTLEVAPMSALSSNRKSSPGPGSRSGYTVASPATSSFLFRGMTGQPVSTSSTTSTTTTTDPVTQSYFYRPQKKTQVLTLYDPSNNSKRPQSGYMAMNNSINNRMASDSFLADPPDNKASNTLGIEDEVTQIDDKQEDMYPPRPSTTPAVLEGNRPSLGSLSSIVNCSSTSSNSIATSNPETHALVEENASLRLEIQQLHEKLVLK